MKLFDGENVVIVNPMCPSEFDLNSGQLQHRRRVEIKKYKLAFIVCTVSAAIGSEFLQSIVSSGKRVFDYKDILYNMLGSALGITLARYQER